MDGNAFISQVDVTDVVRLFTSDIPGRNMDFLINAKKKILCKVARKPYTEATKAHEASIRWKRTATQIIEEGYVYEGKSCTDEVVVFIALCIAQGYRTRFDKLFMVTEEGNFTHSVAEVELDDGWYVVDVNGSWETQKGQIFPGQVMHGFTLWKKGRDAWDLGLLDFNSEEEIYKGH